MEYAPTPPAVVKSPPATRSPLERALLPSADRLMPAHDFASLANLVQALAAE